MIAVPFVGLTETTVSVSPSGSLSFAKTGIVTATFFGVPALSFTATGGRFVTAVTTGALVLLLVKVSSVELLAVAKFVTVPRDVALTVKVRLVIAFAAKFPRLQVTLLKLVVAAGTELTKTIPAG